VSDIDEFQPVAAAGAAVTFHRGDSIDLARQMDSLLNDPAKRRECGSAGRHFAAGLVWDRIAAEFEKFAEEVKAYGPPSRR
jgi:glycosyltransferase involved in cell wall biosynthesis